MKNTSGQDTVGELNDREKLGNGVKNTSSSQGKVGKLSQIKIKSGKSRGLQFRIPQVRENSKNFIY